VANPYTVLVVEQVDVVRRITKRTIVKRGCRVLEAASAEEALVVLARPEIQVDLVLIGTIGTPDPWSSTPAKAGRLRWI
jgi:CheY-like chemotaxis protein